MARQMLRPLTDPSGRTLMELLVSMAIVSMVSLSLASIVILGLRFSRTSQYEDQRVYPVRNGFDMILRDLRTAEAATGDCGGSGIPAAAVRAPDGSLQVVTFTLDAATGRVIRTTHRNVNCSGTPEATTVVAYQITDFHIAYLGDGRFTVRMASTSEDGTDFFLEQEVTGRVLAQP